MGKLLYNSLLLKKFIELYAAIPLILVALAGTYKFGYFSAFDALWVLPSISAYSLFYSILTTTLLFAFGSVLSLIYLTISNWFGHVSSSIFSVLFIIICIFIIGLDKSIALSTSLVPLYFGFFYYFYIHTSLFGNETEREFTSPLTLFLSITAFGFMLGSGLHDAEKAIKSGTLPIVLFEQQPSYPNDQTDWRLLESIDTRFVLVNLKSEWNGRYEIKIVENTKVDSIY